MSIKSYFCDISINSPLTPTRNIAILRRRAFNICEYRVWRRQRLKSVRTLRVRSQFGPLPFENFIENFVCKLPSVNSLDLIAPALSFASGVALFVSGSNFSRIRDVSDVGEWILFTSPTPFNRFVMLRCPSISFDEIEFFEDVSEKLVKEGRHFVRPNGGKNSDEVGNLLEEKLVYQRKCISADDGGIISLDWPANLDLAEEQGLDMTLLLIPGTAEGSMDKNVRSFVCESLKRGCFPVVMNPRGCAGSPLMTARLFTAADSDDICTAIHFINRARPGTTLMAVGWGYGANMLTKYLAEVGERTPLTAATCINNPFDLEEATRSSPHQVALNQKLKDGLINILQANKELFRGRTKGFDVEKALLAKSVRDFEREISMVSYGFDAIEDFYAKCSTQGVVGNVKIPVLFIQDDDGTVPLFSIPRSMIADNPFTSLLLCSSSPSRIFTARFATHWCQHLTLEWLAAVELGILKGRHPLLKDVDVSVSPSQGLALVEGRSSDKNDSVRNLTQLNALSRYSIDPSKKIPEENGTANTDHSRYRHHLAKNIDVEDGKSNESSRQSASVNMELVKEGVGPEDSERGQVLQTAQMVINALEITMPGTVTEEGKKKVLMAVGQGESIMKALQDAVPEDVREKLTTGVSVIFRNQGMSAKFNELLSVGRLPNVASRLKSEIQEEVRGVPSMAGEPEDQMKTVDEETDGSDNSQLNTDKFAGVHESQFKAPEDGHKAIDSGHAQLETSPGADISGSIQKGTSEMGSNDENADLSGEKVAQYSEKYENESGKGANTDIEHQKDQDSGMTNKEDFKEGNNYQQHDIEISNSSSSKNTTNLTTDTEETLPHPASSSESQQMQREGCDSQEGKEKNMHSVPDQNSSDPPSFSVSNALDALTGFDDSAQVAVNSVFGVIEEMITQLEVEKNNEVEIRKDGQDERNDSLSQNHHDDKLKHVDNKTEPSLMLPDHPLYNGGDLQNDERTEWAEEKSRRNPVLYGDNNNNSHLEDDSSCAINNDTNGKSGHSVSKHSLVNSDRVRNYNPLYIAKNPYQESLYKEYLQRYLLSKIPNTQSLDLDTTTAIFLDYIPEEGQWKLLEQPGNIKHSTSDILTHENDNENFQVRSSSAVNYTDKVIEPPYVILDTEKQQIPVGEFETTKKENKKVGINDDTFKEFGNLVYNILLDTLRLEVGRRLSSVDMKDMEPNLLLDMEKVAKSVSHAIMHGKEHISPLDGKEHTSENVGRLHGENIIRAISFSYQDTIYLRRVLPVGVIVGSSLAALRKFFDVDVVDTIGQSDLMTPIQLNNGGEQNHVELAEIEIDHVPLNTNDQKKGWDNSVDKDEGTGESGYLKNGTAMVSAVTAALGASAFLVHQQGSYEGDKTSGNLSESFKEKGNNGREPQNLENDVPEKGQNNIVTSLAEKAMSVASPVVPTKEDGEVDQERLVEMLAGLGQKGGILKLVGKIALLWGGIRGAMSLIGRLLVFLRFSERPLLQRILGFVCMVLVLWSPVVIPLFPTLVQSWAMKNSSKTAELVCIVGLYSSIAILVMLWGQRVRGYDDPLEQYGLGFSLPKVQNFLKGLIGGIMIVLSIQSVNALLGCLRLSWPHLPSSSSHVMTWLKVYGKMLILAGQGIVTATCVAFVEELLFRSWLPVEIATDFGYHRGLIISGLTFSLTQRSPWAIPGLWLLSLGLAGVRQRSKGNLFSTIGLRTGIMASCFFLQRGGFLIYQPNFPIWLAGTLPHQPFTGVVGLAFSLLWAVVLYPRQSQHELKTRTIRQ